MLARTRTASAAAAAPPSHSRSRSRPSAVSVSAMKVCVTGAGGRTGKLVVKRLLEAQDANAASVTSVVATVRGAESFLRIKSDLPELVCAQNDVRVVDVAKLGRAAAASGAESAAAVEDAELSAALQGANALVIVTSGVPQIMKRSIVWATLAKLIGKKGVRPTFRWKAGEEPKVVDWWGQKAQIDAAIANGVKRVVIVSSAGGSDPGNMLNSIGGNGNILQYKRRAEQYLVSQAAAGKVEYTIVHPGGLVDTPALKRPLLMGVDDTLLKRTQRSIPRDDVARVCVAAVGAGGPGVKDAAAAALAFKNKSLDVICEAPAAEGDDGPAAALASEAAAQDLAALVKALGVYDYAINDCSAFE